MREIKFRAYNRRTQKMYKVLALFFYQKIVKLSGLDGKGKSFLEQFDDVVLMQSTGLKDKNGVEIYEGDILKCTSKIYTNLGATRTGEYEETIKQVIWKDDSWGTRVISSNLTSKGAEKSGLVISAKYAEIIGNIYQNKDLLEG